MENLAITEEVRERLNELDRVGAPFSEILELSAELDKLIVNYYRA